MNGQRGIGFAIGSAAIAALVVVGGLVRLESDTGAGATFTIRLPLITGQPAVPL